MFAGTISNKIPVNIVSVVIDKLKSNLSQENYLTTCISQLYKAFDEFLKSQEDIGLIFFDRANEKHINTHVRKLLGTGSSGQDIPGIKINRIIEDPIFRISSDSMFIQAADVISYTLREQEFPNGSRKKFNANRIFTDVLQKNCIKSGLTDKDGVIRL